MYAHVLMVQQRTSSQLFFLGMAVIYRGSAVSGPEAVRFWTLFVYSDFALSNCISDPSTQTCIYSGRQTNNLYKRIDKFTVQQRLQIAEWVKVEQRYSVNYNPLMFT